MKKLLVVLMVLSMATIANAGLQIGVNQQIDQPDSSIIMVPSDTAMISIVGVGIGNQPNVDAWLVLQGPGSNTGGVMVYPGDLAFMAQYVVPDETGTLDWLGTVGLTTGDAYYISFGDSQARPLDGVLVDEIVFHCDAFGEVLLTLVNIFDDGSGSPILTVLDTQVIHQIPEPMTMALLGLGGLFLRRRK